MLEVYTVEAILAASTFIFPYKIHVKIPGILHGKQVKIPGILAPGGDSTVALRSFCEKVVSAPAREKHRLLKVEDCLR